MISKTTRTFTLPDSHLQVLEQEAKRMGLTIDNALAQAIALYQSVNVLGWGGLQQKTLTYTPAPMVPEGWKLVPIEPTEDMRKAGCAVPLNKAARHITVYRAMLAAAPEVKDV